MRRELVVHPPRRYAALVVLRPNSRPSTCTLCVFCRTRSPCRTSGWLGCEFKVQQVEEVDGQPCRRLARHSIGSRNRSRYAHEGARGLISAGFGLTATSRVPSSLTRPNDPLHERSRDQRNGKLLAVTSLQIGTGLPRRLTCCF